MKYLYLILTLFFQISFSQVKISGKVIDASDGSPLSYADVYLNNSEEATSTEEDGSFYLQSDITSDKLIVEYGDYNEKIIPLKKGANFKLLIKLEKDSEEIQEIVYSGKKKRKRRKKENPAHKILRRIWKNKKMNGLYLFDNYAYDKYEKIEIDINNIDSAMMKKKIFKGMEFIFNKIDTSKVSGKSFLPVFINEAIYENYGQNKPSKKIREDLIANKNSGLENYKTAITQMSNFYFDYNIYDNYINLFDKNFTSPLSKTGLLVYNYALQDTIYRNDDEYYRITFHPKRKHDLAFKGSFLVSNAMYAIKEINLKTAQSVNVNFVKDLYIEQEFNILNDTVYLLKRDHATVDVALLKGNKNSKGMYAKRTVSYKNYAFNQKREPGFYAVKTDIYKDEISNKTDEYWSKNRHEKLNDNEHGVYVTLDSLSKTPKFVRLVDASEAAFTGYIPISKLKMKVGNIYNFIGMNEVEGLRLRVGGMTYHSAKDMARLKFYTAYGFKDKQFKYGIEGKWLLNPDNRLTIGLGTKRDKEQLGVALTTDNGIMTRSFASSGIVLRGDNFSLSSVNKTNAFASIEPFKNLDFRVDLSHQQIKSAAPKEFNIDFYDASGNVKSKVMDSKVSFTAELNPGAKYVSNALYRPKIATTPRLLFSYTKGLKGVFNSDFDYHKVNLYYKQFFKMGLFGYGESTIQAGKIFGKVPLSLLNIVPGNQTPFSVSDNFNMLDYYEFVADSYASINYQQHLNGRLLSKIPLIKKLKWREVFMFNTVIGSISEQNKSINASGISYQAPTKPYYEYGAGIENIGFDNFRFFRIDFLWRGNYFEQAKAKFGIKVGFELLF